MYQNIHFRFQKNSKQTNKKARIKKTKETKAEKNISGKWIKRNKFAAARVRVFLVIRISQNKSGLFFSYPSTKRQSSSRDFEQKLKTGLLYDFIICCYL